MQNTNTNQSLFDQNEDEELLFDENETAEKEEEISDSDVELLAEELGLLDNDTEEKVGVEKPSDEIDDVWAEEDGKELASSEEDEEDLFSADSRATMEEETVILNKNKLALIWQLVNNIRDNQEQLEQLIKPYVQEKDLGRIAIGQMNDENFSGLTVENEAGEKVVEGVFDGENMIGPDGKKYSIPSNYASKSKLVEGDIMKLTILPNGTFVYKQIGPIERSRVSGILQEVGENSYMVIAGDNRWRILTASVTYFRGQSGDEVVLLVPRSGGSTWGAVDNIIKKQ